MTPALLLLLAAAPPVPQVTRVSVPDARALPRLRPLLAWASLALPSLRPELVEQALAPLKLDPFAPQDGWAEAGLDPRGPVWLAPGRMALPVRAEAALLAHLEKAGAATATVAGGRGLAAGRPSVVGALVGTRLWLAPYRTLIAEPPDRVRRLAARRGADLAGQTYRPPKRGRPRVPGLPRRAPDAIAQGAGPAPVAGWSGLLWVEPEQAVGWARVQVPARWALGSSAPPRLLARDADVVLEAWAQASPGDVAAGFAGLRRADGRLLSGAVHAGLTRSGALAVAVALRSGAAQATVDAALARLRAANPGVELVRRAKPDRVVAWFPGPEGRDATAAWLEAPPGGRHRAPAGLWVRPPELLEAVAARDAAEPGPHLGAARRVALRLGWGGLLGQPGDVEVTLWKPAQGVEVVVRRDLGDRGH